MSNMGAMAAMMGSRTSRRRNAKVLVVDDEESLRDIVSTRLAFIADDVRVAADGSEAWRMIETDPPDVVVADLMMPGTSGEELCRRIRESAHTRDIYVVFLTARRGAKRRVAGFELGADDYLEKPFDIEELAARVRNGLRLRALQQEVQAAARTETIGWVAYAFGHEIRNPLAVIMANSSLQRDHVRHIVGLGRAARGALAALDQAGATAEADAIRAAMADHQGTARVAMDLREMSMTNRKLARRAAAAVSALQRFAEGASGAPTLCDPLVLIQDAVRLAFAGSAANPVLRIPQGPFPSVWCVPRDVLLALATALSRASTPERTGAPPTIEVVLVPGWVTIRIDGPGDGTSPEDLLVPRIANQAPGERRTGLDVGLAHALIALRSVGAGLSVGPRGDGGVVVEIVLPMPPPGYEAD